MPSVGKLRHRLTIQSRSDSADGDGFRTEAWSNGDTVWCEIKQLNMGERNIAAQIMPHATHQVTMRDGHTVNSEDRLSGTLHSSSRVFLVLSVERMPDERASSFLKLICQEIPAE